MTVVVATRDRPDALRRCLDALDRQTCEVEIIVVDDGSIDAGAVATAVGAFPRARLLRSDGQGLAAARNAGAALARAAFVCFTDDDCEPASDWAELIAAHLRDDAEAVAGRTIVADRSDRVAIAAQVIADHLADSTRRGDGTIAYSPGSNLGCRLATILAVPFDESYPRTGGEDRDWCARIVAGGHRFVAAPEAVVLHRPSLTPWSFWRRQLYYGSCSSRFRRTSPGIGQVEAPRFYAELIRRGFEHGPAVGVLVVAAQLAAGIGTAADRLGALR